MGSGLAGARAAQYRRLLRDETIDAWTAANLWAALARRQSLAVVAGESEVGKTTLLTALLDFLPPNTRRVYPRGCFETFAFLSDPAINPSQTALLINEISPHLPVYLWGPAVGRILEAAQRGFMLLATAHADSVHEFVGAFTGSPLRIPLARAAAFEFVVVMERDEDEFEWEAYTRRLASRANPGWRRASRKCCPMPAAVQTISVSTTPHPTDSETWFPMPELARRQSRARGPTRAAHRATSGCEFVRRHLWERLGPLSHRRAGE